MDNTLPLSEALEPRCLLSAGQLASSFANDGRLIDDNLTAALDIAVQRDGRIVAAGYRNEGPSGGHRNMLVTRYNSDGTLDTSFGSGGRVTLDFGQSSMATALAIARNGDIVVAGGRSVPASAGADIALARLDK